MLLEARLNNFGPGLYVVRIGKTKWIFDISNWLVTQLTPGKYGFNKDTLEPDYSYFEYWFLNSEDALAFRMTFSDTFNGYWTEWENF